MDYQVWTYDPDYKLWDRKECGDRQAAMREIENSVRSGKEPMLTVAIPYSVNIIFGDQVAQKPEPDPKKTKPEPVEEDTKPEVIQAPVKRLGKQEYKEKTEEVKSETETSQPVGDPGPGG